MRRQHLFSLCMCCLLAFFAGQAAYADDVTSQYLTNADFTTDTALTNGVTTYSYDMSNVGTTYYGLQPVTGWTANVPTDNVAYSSTCDMDARAGGVFAYGDTTWLGGTSYVVPSTGPDGSSEGQALGVIAVWSSSSCYYSDTITLAAGTYTVTIPVYNAGGTGSITNHTGFYQSDGTTVKKSSSTTYSESAWTTDTITFSLSEETEGYFTIGFLSSNGSGSTPHLFYDGVTIDYSSDYDETTAADFSGEYYIYSPDENMYLSWGGDWGTRAILEPAGQPIVIEAMGDGTYTLHNPDFSDGTYLFLASAADQAFWDNSYYCYWTITASDDGEGYYLVNTYNNYYMATTGWVTNNNVYSIGDRNYTYCPIVTVASQDEATKWKLFTDEDCIGDAGMTLAKDFNAKAAASLSGISGISSSDDLDALLTEENGYYSLDMTSEIANPNYSITTNSVYLTADNGWELETKYSWSYYSAQKYLKYASVAAYVDLFEALVNTNNNTNDTVTGNTVDTLLYLDTAGGMGQTISGLPAGLYKVSTSAIAASMELYSLLTNAFDEDDLEGAYSHAYAFAKSGSQWSACKAKEYQGEPLSDLYIDVTSDDTDEWEVSFTEVYAEEVLQLYALDNYVYVGEGEDLDIGLMLPHHVSGTYDNVYAYQWTLTYYTDEAYTIGSPTCSLSDGSSLSDGCYVGVDEFDGTVTATFVATSIYDDATISTINENATATLTAEDGTVYTGTITVDSLTLTITFSDYELTTGTTYTLTIPSGIIGFSEENTNAEASISFETKLDIEGAGYLLVADSEYSYLSRGSSWGTRAITDSYGAPVKIAYADDGVTFNFLDNGCYLFEADAIASTIYTDNNTYPYWIVKAVDGGYVIYDGNDTDTYGQPLCYDSDGNLAVVEDGEAIVWTIQSIEDHNAYLQSLSDATAAATAAEFGLSAESKEALAELLADTTLFETSDVDITGKTSSSSSEFYQGTQGEETTIFTETVSGLDAGIYKVGVQAYFRVSSNEVTDSLYFRYGDLAQGAAFLVANDASEQLVSVMSEGYEEAAGSDDYLASDALYHPNATGQGDAAFEDGLYNNEVYAYVGEDGELTFSLLHGINYTAYGWVYYDNFSVTKYALIAELGDSLDYISVDPADGDSVDVLSTITITYDEEVSIADDAVLYVVDEAGDTITTATLTADGTIVTITLADEITETGETYTITIPAATIGDATAASSSFQYGNANSEFSLSYIVPAIQVVETIVVEVELTEGTSYQGETAEFSVDAVCTALGVSDISLCSQYIVNATDGSYVTNTSDGWRNSDGDMATWDYTSAGMVCVKIQDASSGIIDYIGTIDTSYEAGDEYDALWAFVYGYSAVIIDVHITFVEAEVISADDFTVVGSTDITIIAELDEDGSYATTTGDIDEDAIAEALGCTSIDEATLAAVVDGSVISVYTANYGYYFNSSGEVCDWGSVGCAFFVEWYGSGYSYLACGQYPDGMEEGDSYTVTLYFIYGDNAYSITLTYTVDTDTATGISSISSGNGTFDATSIYSLSGQLIRTQATSLEGLPQGIYIVGGQKVLVK